MKYQGIIFDFNGTLFFDSHYHDLAWKQVSKQLRGFEVSDEEIQSNIHGKNNEAIINYIMGGNISAEKNKEVSIQKEAIYREMCKSQATPPALAKGVETWLDELKKRNIPMSIASASILDNMQFYVTTFQLDRWFDSSLFVYDDGTHRDKVTMFQEAAKRLNISIKETLVFEDSISGIQFAHASGVKDIIAIDSVKQPERYQQFPYLKAVWSDFQDACEILDDCFL